MKLYLYISVIAVLLFCSCEEVIDVQLDDVPDQVVVDGYVEAGLPPYIILSRTSGYFDPISSAILVNDAITGAQVYVSDGIDTVRLFEPGIIPGLYVAIDTTTLVNKMTGVPGRTYSLWITTPDGTQLSSEAKLEVAVQLDSVWFQLVEDNDSLGLAYGQLDEPDTLGNCYRWHTKRLGKDELYIAPLGAVFDDRFINAQNFELFYNRGSIQNSDAEDDNNEEAGLFKTGDTIVVKFSAVSKSVYEFWRIAEQQQANNGSPFAVPSNIPTNIKGGIGLFGTYSSVFDTIIARP